ncbi:succinylglutamate desuccinylase [Marinobacter sp.]|uniref:succinylglutamate desuccinylase n=1 Tax=Marinobacter sp. TaxID=50741 RepID=UPI00384C2256
MTPREQLFEQHPDWLAFTLANPTAPTSGRHASLADGSRIEMRGPGLLRLMPASPQPDLRLIVSAGIHGNETAPIEVLNRLVNELLVGEWSLATETLLILGNPPAMVAGRRFMDHNLNRLFNGAHQKPLYAGSPEALRAELLEHTCRAFASGAPQLVHYDLHTAIKPSEREKFALYPFIPDRKVPGDQLSFLAASDVHTLLLQHAPGTTFAAFSSKELEAESMTVELGRVRPFGQNEAGRFRGIENSLRDLLKGGDPGASADASQVVIFEVVEEIINTGREFRFHVPEDAANFTEYAPGEVIWEDAEQTYRVGPRPEVIIFPNRDVPVGQRVGLMARKQTPAT